MVGLLVAFGFDDAVAKRLVEPFGHAVELVSEQPVLESNVVLRWACFVEPSFAVVAAT